MKLLRIEAHNVKKISDVDLNLDGHHLYVIGGKNRAGKSSALDAIEYALCGKSSLPGKPLRAGEKSGKVRLTLSGDKDLHQTGFVVEREFFEGGKTTLKLLSDDGFEAPQPQTLLDGFYERAGFDPLAFTRMKPKEQLDELRKIVGLDFAELDRERQRVYDERTAVNNHGKALKARVDAMPNHADAPETEIKASDLVAELERLNKINSENAGARRDLNGFESERTRLVAEVTSKDMAIVKMKRQLAEAESDYAKAKVVADNYEKTISDHRAKVSALVDVDTCPIKKQIDEADLKNRKLRENVAKAAGTTDLDEFRKKSQSLTDRLTKIDAEKQAAMSAAKWPVSGMGFDESGIVLNGLPFDQASSAEQLQVSVAMGMAMNPKLRLLVIRDGSLLDDESLAAISAQVTDKDYQVIVEVVTRTQTDEDRCCVVIEEGHVKGTA